MIGKLSGVLLEKNPPAILIDCAGVGYEVQVPMSTYYRLPETGQPVSLRTHFAVREDAQLLYGFASDAERAAFRALIKVAGIGARTALALLSGMSASELAQAVARQEVQRLVKVPGIGKKTAERLLLELQGKLGDAGDMGGMGETPALADARASASAQADNPAHHDIRQALVALGYSEKEAAGALKHLPVEVGVSDGIRLALKSLNR